MSSSHQSKFPCIIITIIIILLFFSSFSTLLTVNLFVLFWRCFVRLNSYFVCFIIYIFFFNFSIFFVDIIFVPKIVVCFSFYPVSLIFEYEAKPHIRWPHIREYEAGESGANFTSVSSLLVWLWIRMGFPSQKNKNFRIPHCLPPVLRENISNILLLGGNHGFVSIISIRLWSTIDPLHQSDRETARTLRWMFAGTGLEENSDQVVLKTMRSCLHLP